MFGNRLWWFPRVSQYDCLREHVRGLFKSESQGKMDE